MVADLWRRQHPDLLVALDLSLEQLRARRENPVWPAWLLDLQRDRLADAMTHADVVIDTDAMTPAEVAHHMLVTLGDANIAAEDGAS